MKIKMRTALIGLTTFCACLSAGAKDWSQIRVATEGAYAPWNYVEASGKLAGFDIDVTTELCKRMKAHCDIVAQAWDGIIPALNAGKYDAIVAAMVITPARRTVVDFTVPYADGPRTFIVQKANALSSIHSEDTVLDLGRNPGDVQRAVDELKPMLKGKVVGVQTSTTHVLFLEKYFKDVVTVREYKTSQDMILDLESGRIDAAFDGIAFLGGTLTSAEGQNLTFIGPRVNRGLFGEGSAIAVRKSDRDLRDQMNLAISQARDDGTLKKLSMKWFHVDISPNK